ncbi:unnamed protein product [Didymodactylos carnosus]|uniref:Uncharacterized protein n=1 Tax=Didymodactylos carnosus TaxID=1234261 RepID=A0A814JW27_9BILA|nr:unnamed protein product [Didymodactylos carnosus]CAF1041109.1 unnamed protein product [Didymodactylos carnosus]CAF3581972.1 unnamed protein product [Didymodactylos carnosus]CAF3811321.1 unnamed protein product [Didymodactylos carnosus]
MTNKKSLTFVQQPFQATVDDSETLVVVLNELIHQLDMKLSFTSSNFNYDDSDYRTACGIADLGSFHSILTSADDIKTAKFNFHLKLIYSEIVRTGETLKDFILNFLYSIASTIRTKTEFIRVFSVEEHQSNQISVKFGITAKKENETKVLAESLKSKSQNLSDKNNILKYVIPESYTYALEPALIALQLQKSDFEPKYNIDYKNFSTQIDQRGRRDYYFPIGWYRHALKVEDKYSNDKLWLRMKNIDGEWNVAYHGTKSMDVKSIIRQGLSQDKVTRDVFRQDAVREVGFSANVEGIYLATHCEGGVSPQYTDPFEVKNNNGDNIKYRVVLQCRVQPNKYTEHNGATTTGSALRVLTKKPLDLMEYC